MGDFLCEDDGYFTRVFPDFFSKLQREVGGPVAVLTRVWGAPHEPVAGRHHQRGSADGGNGVFKNVSDSV